MNLSEIKKTLDNMFLKEPSQGSKRNIVFWYDEDGNFSEYIDDLDLSNAKIIKLYDNNEFYTKYYIEELDLESNLLVYAPIPRPNNRVNILTDTIKYSQIFSADETSINLLNYKIDPSLRNVMDRYKLFFRNIDRCKKFESYSLKPYTEIKIDIGVLSALCKLKVPSLDRVLETLLIEMLSGENTIYKSIEKFADLNIFWDIIEKHYGFNSDKKSLEELSSMLLVSHLFQTINSSFPIEWEEYKSFNTNSYVFVDNFMKDMDLIDKYDALAKDVSYRINLKKYISKWSIDEIIDCDTFEDFDRLILIRYLENITKHQVGEYEKYRKDINLRRNRRYFNQFKNEYDLLYFACLFLELFKEHKEFSGKSLLKLYENYIKNLYKFDLYYRQFINTFDKMEHSDLYIDLFDIIEKAYTNNYLSNLSSKWSDMLNYEKKWGITDLVPQQNFYGYYLEKSILSNERVIVIISDALRYESAKEFFEILNNEQRGTWKMENMLGVLPSYTKLAMAALLPHKSIKITDSGDVLVDGLSTLGTENREKILKRVKPDSVAITYGKLMSMSRHEMASKFNGVKLIYIYHNCIDARGDNPPTEKEVFDATEKSFKELSQLIRTLKNNVSAINIIITADHGYIYRRQNIPESGKTSADAFNFIEYKRRFILTKDEAIIQNTKSFSMGYLDPGMKKIKAIVPLAANCFKFQGTGSNYTHGGASLQEVVIPVIKFKSDKNSKKSLAAKKVTISLINIFRKITNVITYLSFFQNEKVEDKVLPLRA
ncbi:MAG: BREX-1 system phosphatase PglZ type A, partial [Oscillospiraceae bacterium]|nr:BREX-1 system phosphatase PglZ type A [Oscillospiraceae bacterium]